MKTAIPPALRVQARDQAGMVSRKQALLAGMSASAVRDNNATATVGSTLRYGWDEVTRRNCETAAQVYAALRRRGYQGAITPCSPACRAHGVVAGRSAQQPPVSRVRALS